MKLLPGILSQRKATLIYETDFSATPTGTAIWELHSGSPGDAITYNNDGIFGENDCAALTLGADNSLHHAKTYWLLDILTAGNRYRLTGKFLVPSTNTLVDSIGFQDNLNGISGDLISVAPDVWHDHSIQGTATGTGILVSAQIGANPTFASAGDVIYFKDIKAYSLK